MPDVSETGQGNGAMGHPLVAALGHMLCLTQYVMHLQESLGMLCAGGGGDAAYSGNGI